MGCVLAATREKILVKIGQDLRPLSLPPYWMAKQEIMRILFIAVCQSKSIISYSTRNNYFFLLMRARRIRSACILSFHSSLSENGLTIEIYFLLSSHETRRVFKVFRAISTDWLNQQLTREIIYLQYFINVDRIINFCCCLAREKKPRLRTMNCIIRNFI